MASLTKRIGSLFRRPAPAPSAALPSVVASYMRREASPFFQMWVPRLRDSQSDVREAWSLAAARSTDLIQNSGWIAGGVEQAVVSIMGSGLRLNSAPDAIALGITADAAQELGRKIEHRWDSYSRAPAECDAAGRWNIAQLTAAAIRQWFATGEIVAQLPSIGRPGCLNRTKVRLIQSHRIARKTDMLTRTIDGIRLDADGQPVGYWFTGTTAAGSTVEQQILARDDVGRPQIIHVFDGVAGQVRGISPMVPALLVAKQFDQLANATLMAAIIQAIFAATIESDAPTADILNAFQDPESQGVAGNIDDFLKARMGWYSGANVDIGQHGKIAHLFMGEKLNINRSEHPNDTYEAFARFLLREIARCLGITYGQLTGDHTGATYSSVRMANSEIWQITSYRRENIAARFLQAVYEAWLEEEIEARRIIVPGGLDAFLGNRSAFSAAIWRGPAKPEADAYKQAQAHKVWREMGVITDESIAGELGEDIETVYEQRAREKALRERLGIEEAPPALPGFEDAPPDDDEREDDPGERTRREPA